MAKGDYWSDSQRQAWQYVVSAQQSGLGEAAALQDYRAGGGAIRTSFWVGLWHQAETAGAQWDTMYKLKGSDTVPESMYAATGINYKNKYNAVFKFEMLSPDGITTSTQYRTVTSTTRLTMDEWKSGLAEAAYDYEQEDYGSVTSILSIEFYENENL